MSSFSTDKRADRTYLREVAYADPSGLAAPQRALRAPAPANRPRTGSATPEQRARVPTWAEPDDAARLVAWLCTDDAKWVNGQVIDSTGGSW